MCYNRKIKKSLANAQTLSDGKFNMKTLLKWILRIILLMILVFLSLFTYFLIFPENTLDKKINDTVTSKLGFETIEEKSSVGDKIIPLARSLIEQKYPELKTKKIFGKVIEGNEYVSLAQKKWDEMILETQKEIAKARQTVSDIDQIITANDSLLLEQTKEFETGCVKEILYIDCDQLGSTLEKNKVDIPKTKAEAQKAKNRWQKWIDEAEKNLKNLKTHPVGAEKQAAVTFNNTYYIKYVGNDVKPADYLKHALHESFHALSYGTLTTLPAPLDEGLTDYFAVKSFESYIGMKVSSSFIVFPYQVKLVELLTNIISEKDLLSIYLAKDETRLKTNVDAKLGAGSYDKIITDITTIFRESIYSGSYDIFSKENDLIFNNIEKIFDTQKN